MKNLTVQFTADLIVNGVNMGKVLCSTIVEETQDMVLYNHDWDIEHIEKDGHELVTGLDPIHFDFETEIRYTIK